MSTVESNLLVEFGERLDQELVDIEQQRDTLREQLHELNAQARKIQRLKAALNGGPPKKKPPAKSSNGKVGTQFASETLAKGREQIASIAPEFPDGFTTGDLAGRGLPVADTVLSQFMSALRENEMVRLAGKRANSHVYKLAS